MMVDFLRNDPDTCWEMRCPSVHSEHLELHDLRCQTHCAFNISPLKMYSWKISKARKVLSDGRSRSACCMEMHAPFSAFAAGFVMSSAGIT